MVYPCRKQFSRTLGRQRIRRAGIGFAVSVDDGISLFPARPLKNNNEFWRGAGRTDVPEQPISLEFL